MSELIEELEKQIPVEIPHLVKSRVITYVKAIIDFDFSEIEYALFIHVGALKDFIPSEKLRQGGILKISFPLATSIIGIGAPLGEELTKLGVLQKIGGASTLDLAELGTKVNSEMAIVTIRQKLPQQLRDRIVKVHINKAAERRGTVFKYDMEMLTMNVPELKTAFQFIEIKNIVFTINLEQVSGIITESLPNDFLKHLRWASTAMLGGDAGTRMRFARAVDGYGGSPMNFLALAAAKIWDSVTSKIPVLVEKNTVIEPSNQFQLLSVDLVPPVVKTQGFEYPAMYIPDNVRIKLRTSLENGVLARKGTITLDLSALVAETKSLAKDVRLLSKNSNFELEL